MRYARHWTVLQDGGSDVWLYVRNVGLAFIFIELIDLPAHCGSDADVAWCSEVSVVDLATVSVETQYEALRSVGCDSPTTMGLIGLAEVLHSYGAKAPLRSDSAGKPSDVELSENSIHFRRLRKEAREFAETLLDNEARDELLDSTIVNAIGQTAREFANGTQGLWDALRRIKADDNATDEQKLVLKMYGNARQTLGAGPVPEDLCND